VIAAGSTLAAMRCPACESDDTKVIDSRPADDGSAIRRRRSCPECGFRFTTFERCVMRAEPEVLTVVKRDGSSEVFDPSKIMNGVTAASKGRPVSPSDVDTLIVAIEDMIRADGGAATSEQVGQAVLTRLRALDHVAYLRFASVYKGFDQVDDFLRELALLDSER
jgi:transcriptional repressor NrdR